MPPSDPALVEEVQDSDSAEPALVRKSGLVKQTVAGSRQADEAVYGRGPVKQMVAGPRQAGEAVYGKGPVKQTASEPRQADEVVCGKESKSAVAAKGTSTPAAPVAYHRECEESGRRVGRKGFLSALTH